MSQHPIWRIGLFEKNNNKETAECLECRQNGMFCLLKLPNKSIKSLKTHLFGKHNASSYTEMYLKLEEGKLSVLDKNIMNYIACCNIPFLTINHPAFRKLVKNNFNTLLDESHYRKEVLPEVYKIVKNKIKNELNEIEHVSCTTDMWSADTTKDAFISLTACGVTPTFSLKKFTLAIQKFSGSHTAEKIAEVLQELLDKWEVNAHCVLCDSAANIVKATELMGITRMSCAAHDLNLCVKSCIGTEKDELAQLFEKCRKIVGTLKHSSKFTDELKDIQVELGLPKEKLMQDISTRWNSSLKMIQRLVNQEEAIDEFLVFTRNGRDVDFFA